MLVLTRKLGETIVIGDNVTLTLVKVAGNQVRLAINAPKNVSIVRNELIDRQSEDPCDGDLAEKPADWLDVKPCVVVTR